MEYMLHIKPTFNCLVKSNNFEQLLNKDKLHTFLIKDLDVLPLSFYPTDEENKNALPFACKLSFINNNLTSNKKQTEIVCFPDNNYLLTVEPFLFCFPSTFESKTQAISFGETEHTVSWLKNDFCNIKISCNESNFEIENTEKILNLNLLTSKNILLGYAKTNKNKHLVFSVRYENKKYYLLSKNIVDILEVENEDISTYKNLFDFAGHGIVTNYKKENNYIEEILLAYNYDLPLIAKHKEFIPYAFFEAIKIKNYKLARNYLTPELSNKLTDTHFEKFFGNFNRVSQTLSPTFNCEEIALIYNFSPSIAKIFNVKINNQNKIENIYEN